MNASEIIDYILKKEKIKAATFATSIGVTATQIYDLQSGKTKSISSSMANKIMTTYSHYNKIWLLTGEGIPANNISNNNIGQNFGSIGGNNKSSYTNVGNSSNDALIEQLKLQIKALENEKKQLELRLGEKDAVIKAKDELIEILRMKQ